MFSETDINHLKSNKFTQSIIKSYISRKLCSFNRERKSNSSFVTAYIHCETIVIHLDRVIIQDFKCSLTSLKGLYNAPYFSLVHIPQFFLFFLLSVFITLFIDKQPSLSQTYFHFHKMQFHSSYHSYLLKVHILLKQL